MEEGHFDNLPGKGKPLNLGVNPHADPAEDTLYRILSKWVELNKDIRSNISIWRLTLKKAWENRRTGDFSKWEDSTEALKFQIWEISNKASPILLDLTDVHCDWDLHYGNLVQNHDLFTCSAGLQVHSYRALWPPNVWIELGEGVGPLKR